MQPGTSHSGTASRLRHLLNSRLQVRVLPGAPSADVRSSRTSTGFLGAGHPRNYDTTKMLLSAVEKSVFTPAITLNDATACSASPTVAVHPLSKSTRISSINGVLF